MSTLNLVFTVLGGLSAAGVVLRFILKGMARVVSELVEQTRVFKNLDRKLTGMSAALTRIEARQKQAMIAQNGKIQ